MARLPLTLLIILGALFAGALIVTGASAQSPDHVLGTEDGNYQLFAPSTVVQTGLPDPVANMCLKTNAAGTGFEWGACGGGGDADAAVTKFFQREDLGYPSPNVPLSMTTATPLTWDLMPSQTISGGILAGPFFTQYDGAFQVTFAANETLTLTVTTHHIFPDGQTLVSTREITYRAARAQLFTIPWNDFSSVTDVAPDARLAEPVTIRISASLAVSNNANLTSFTEQGGAVSFWQPNDRAAVAAALSDNTPKVDAGAGAAGSGTEGSRDDHVHPTPFGALPGGTANNYLKSASSALSWQGGEIAPHFTSTNKDDCLRINQVGSGISWRDCPSGSGGGGTLSNNTPIVESGAGAAGTGSEGSRDDHVHPSRYPAPPGTLGLALSDLGTGGKAGWVDPLAGLRGVPQTADQGKIVRIAPDLSSSATEFVYDDPHAAVLAGLPALTGHGGNCLKANAGATGLEFAACGGAGGGGGAQWEDILSRDYSVPDNRPDNTYTGTKSIVLTQTERTAFRTALNNSATLAVRIIGLSNDACIYQSFFGTIDGALPGGTITAHAPVQEWCADDAGSSFDGTLETEFWTTSAAAALVFRDTDTLAYVNINKFKLQKLVGGGGGGGGGGPTIPDPTAAGALKHLRVNAAGAAYELADPPVPSDAEPQVVAVTPTSGAAGTAAAFSRADHLHAIDDDFYSAELPKPPAAAAATGTALSFARNDHVHAAPPRLAYRQVDSVDLRTGQQGYGFWVPAGGNATLEGGGDPYHPWTVYINDGTYTPLGYDPTKPGLLLDGDTGQWNSNGVDFTNANAGSTKREIDVILQVGVDNGRNYASSESITVTMAGRGRATDDGTEKNIASQTIHFNGGTDPQPAMYFTFKVTYTGAPRSGTADAIWFGIETKTSPGRITVAGSKSRFHQALPDLGPRPSQKTTIEGSSTFFPAAADIPAGVNLGSTPTLYFHQVISPDTRGKNAPAETDHSDWVPIVASDNSTIVGMQPTQDLSTLHITAAHGAGAVDHTGGSVYLVRKRSGVAHVLGRADHVSGWKIDWIGNGQVTGDRFYLLGDKRDATAAVWTWNADLVGTRRDYPVVPGYLSRLRFKFSGASTSSVTIPGLADRMDLINNVTLHGGSQLENLGPFWGITSGLTTVLNPFWGDLSLPHAIFTKSGSDLKMSFQGTHPQNGTITAENVAVTLVDIVLEAQQ